MSIKLLVPVDVVIDSREDAAHPEFKSIIMREGLRVAVQELPAGDFLLLSPPGKQCLLIERKTADDFANSIKDGRIWDQSTLLKDAALKDGHKPVIVIEGSFEKLEKYRGWKIQSLLRVMDSLVLDMNIPVIYTPHKDATIAWIIAKARSLGRTEDKRVLRMRVEKKPMSLEDRILYVAEGLVGPTLARRLLQRFKTLRNIANASVHELMSVEGIGEKRAQEIFAIFNTPWQEEVVNQ
ncbi:MAG: ERCC4 domain-containing protein [Desulfurococcaceae archaeon]